MFNVTVPFDQALTIPLVKELRDWISIFKESVFSRDQLDSNLYWKNMVIGAQVRPLVILEDDKGVKLTPEQQKQKISELFNLLENFFYFPDLLVQKANDLTSAIILYLLVDTYIRLVEDKENSFGFSLDENKAEQSIRRSKGYQSFESSVEAIPVPVRIKQVMPSFDSLITQYQSLFVAEMSQIPTKGSPSIASVNLWKQLLDYCIKFSVFLSSLSCEAAEYYIILHELAFKIKYLAQHLHQNMPRRAPQKNIQLLVELIRMLTRFADVAREKISTSGFFAAFVFSLHTRKNEILNAMDTKFFNDWNLQIDFTHAVIDRPIKKEQALGKVVEAAAAEAEADTSVKQVHAPHCENCKSRLADSVYDPCGHNSLCWLCIYKAHYAKFTKHTERYKCVTCKNNIKKIYRC